MPSPTSQLLDGSYILKGPLYIDGLVGISGGSPWIDVTAPFADIGGTRYQLGATGNGVTDDTAAIQNAINAANTGSGGVVYFPIGQYLVSSTLTITPPANGSNPVPAPSLVGAVPPGRVGDLSDNSPCQLVCSNTFPIGSFVIQYNRPAVGQAPTGAEVKNLGIKCVNRGAGILIYQPRRFSVKRINIDHSATPSAMSGSPTGGFSCVSIDGSAPAYNHFEQIGVSQAAQDGFHYACNSDDTFINCHDLNAARYSYNVAGAAKFLGCHYEASQTAWNIQGGNFQVEVIGSDSFGIPTGPCVRIVPGTTGQFQVKFVDSTIMNAPGAGPGEEAGSVVTIVAGGQPTKVVFTACDIIAGANTTDWVFVEAACAAGSNATFGTCSFSGTPTTNKWKDNTGGVLTFRDCPGINPIGSVTTPGFPATTVPVTNTLSTDIDAYITNGTGALTVDVGAVTSLFTIPASQVALVRIPAGASFTPHYSAGTPTWKWYGE